MMSSRTVLIGVGALVLGGVVVAAAEDQGFCVRPNGRLRARSSAVCRNNETPLVGSATGPQGPQGLTGDMGPVGPGGNDGAPGAEGAPGAAGARGAQGAAGARGPAGSAANVVSIVGTPVGGSTDLVGIQDHIVSVRDDDAFNPQPCAGGEPGCVPVVDDAFTSQEAPCCHDRNPIWVVRNVGGRNAHFPIDHDSYCDSSAVVFLHQALDCADDRYMLRDADRLSMTLHGSPDAVDGRAIGDNMCEIIARPGELYAYARHNPVDHTMCVAGDPDGASLFQSVEFAGLSTQSSCADQFNQLANKGFEPESVRQFTNPDTGRRSCCIVLASQFEVEPGNVGPAFCDATPDPAFQVDGVPAN